MARKMLVLGLALIALIGASTALLGQTPGFAYVANCQA
jgi:hypothetical protein